MSVRVAVFASGGGSNLQALLDAFAGVAAPASVVLVISDREGAHALARAEAAGVRTLVLPFAGRDEEEVGAELLDAFRAAEVELVALAGFLRRVPAALVRVYRGRMLNIHPALLPSFGGKGMYGLRVHRAVLDAGCSVTGATVHFVDEEYDSGPILIQWPVPVLAGDTAEGLAARVLEIEHRVYPAAVEAVARGLRQDGRAGGPHETGGGASGRPTAGTAPGSGAFALSEPLHFALTRTSPPTLAEVRQAIGLEPAQDG